VLPSLWRRNRRPVANTQTQTKGKDYD
jgi:hypothetical protein